MESPFCDYCHNEEDSNEHMLIHCEYLKKIWKKIETWILEIVVIDYTIDEEPIILGELQKSHWINAIILITKKNNL